MTRSPIRGAGQAGNVFGPLADGLAAAETELVDDSNNSFQSLTKILLSWIIHLHQAPSSFTK